MRWIKKIILPVVLLAGFGGAARVSSAPKSSGDDPKTVQADSMNRFKAFNSPNTGWVEASLQQMQTVKVGMTRAKLAKFFMTEGGLSTRTWRRYVYRECPLIKVDVEFKSVGTSKKPYLESGDDVITKISKPFLEERIMN